MGRSAGSVAVWEGRRERETAGGRRHSWGAWSPGRWEAGETEGWGWALSWKAREAKGRRECARHHCGIGERLALGGVRRGDRIDDRLGFLLTDLLVVLHHVTEVVAAGVMGLAHTHRVVREVDIAVVAKEFRHLLGLFCEHLAAVARETKIPVRDGNRLTGV